MSRLAMYFGRFLMLLIVATAILAVVCLGSCSSFKPVIPTEVEIRMMTPVELDSMIRERQREYAMSRLVVPPAPVDDRTQNVILISCFVTASVIILLIDVDLWR